MLKLPNDKKVWVCSDLHLNHVKILEYTNRGKVFSSLQEMNEEIIKRWRLWVQPEDLVLLLGDVLMGQQTEMEGLLNQLTGRIILVEGNHDKTIVKKPHLSKRFEAIHKILNIGYKGHCAVLCHFPLSEWENRTVPAGWQHLHGHLHGGTPAGGWVAGRLDVGLDAFCSQNYHPREIQEAFLAAGYAPKRDYHEAL